MNIYGPGDGIPSSPIDPNNKPYIPKRLRQAGIDMKWIKDNKNLFGGYWQFYTKDETKQRRNKK